MSAYGADVHRSPLAPSWEGNWVLTAHTVLAHCTHLLRLVIRTRTHRRAQTYASASASLHPNNTQQPSHADDPSPTLGDTLLATCFPAGDGGEIHYQGRGPRPTARMRGTSPPARAVCCAAFPRAHMQECKSRCARLSAAAPGQGPKTLPASAGWPAQRLFTSKQRTAAGPILTAHAERRGWQRQVSA